MILAQPEMGKKQAKQAIPKFRHLHGMAKENKPQKPTINGDKIMSAKTQVNIKQAYRLLHPMHTVLVSCVGNSAKPNVTTLAWAMPTSVSPPLLAVSIAPGRHSHTLIEETGEFIVNIPTLETLQAVYTCGNLSGRSFDKFKKCALTPLPGKSVKAPAIAECVAHLECEVDGQMTTGDHTIFVGKILEAYADKGAWTDAGWDIKRAHHLYHAGGNNFLTLDPKIYKA